MIKRFDRMDADVVKTLVIPTLELLASPEYQERTWVQGHHHNLADCLAEFTEVFYETCGEASWLGEEGRLDEKEWKSLEGLYNSARQLISDRDTDVQAMITHPDWVVIQRKAKELADTLRVIVVARMEDIIETYLIPSLERLASRTFQQDVWGDPKGISNYYFWLWDFGHIYDYMISQSDDDLNNPCTLYKGSLNPQEKKLLSEVYKVVDEFHDAWGRDLSDDVSTLINHPEWIKIQSQAAAFAELLKNNRKQIIRPTQQTL